jgi:hypothetical protein
VVTYATRREALLAKRALDGRMLFGGNGGSGPRELAVEWALRSPAVVALHAVPPWVAADTLLAVSG